MSDQWKPESIAPRDGTRIQVIDMDDPDSSPEVAHWEQWGRNSAGWLDDDGDGAGYWTHWRPLPDQGATP